MFKATPLKHSRTSFMLNGDKYDVIRCMYRHVNNVKIITVEKQYTAYNTFQQISASVPKYPVYLVDYRIYGIVCWEDVREFHAFLEGNPKMGSPYNVCAGILLIEYIFKNDLFSHTGAVIKLYHDLGSIVTRT